MLPDLLQPILKVSPAKTRHTSILALAQGFHGFFEPAFAQSKVLVVIREGQA